MQTSIYACPSCSAAVTFKARDTNLTECHQCHELLHRVKDGLLLFKKELTRTEDHSSAIQLGTTGYWKGEEFTVIGRLRCYFADDIVNNWTICFQGGITAILRECGSQLAICEAVPPDSDLTYTRARRLNVGGNTIKSKSGEDYILERKTNCSKTEVEGEVAVFDWDGRFSSVEVASLEGLRREIIELTYGETLDLSLQFGTWATFQFKQLRSQEIGAVTKTFNCTACQKPNDLKSFPQARSFCCKHCGYAISWSDGKLKQRGKLGQDKVPAIALYTTGVLKDVEYELVGFAVKEDAYGYSWREYTLFNPVSGYAFLSEFNGHWIFLLQQADAPVIHSRHKTELTFQGESFHLYNDYSFRFIEVRGEFPGDAFETGRPHCREFIAPPKLWSQEKENDGLTWYLGEHISKKELHKAFGNEIALPYQIGTGAIQPITGFANPGILKRSIIAAVVFLLILNLISGMLNKEQLVFSETYTFADSASTVSVVTPKFYLDLGSSNVELTLEADVANNWLETNITLINADNGKEYATEIGVEYYAGIEDGESWSEGKRRNDVLLTSVPRGNYFMEIIASKTGREKVRSFTIEAHYDVPMLSNFLIILAIAIIPGLGLYGYTRLKEKARWANSNYSPYNTAET